MYCYSYFYHTDDMAHYTAPWLKKKSPTHLKHAWWNRLGHGTAPTPKGLAAHTTAMGGRGKRALQLQIQNAYGKPPKIVLMLVKYDTGRW